MATIFFNFIEPITLNDLSSLAQSIIAFGSLVLLIITIRLQHKANKTQKELHIIEIAAKRAEFMPLYDIEFEDTPVDSTLMKKGIVVSDHFLKFKVTVLENTIVNYKLEFTIPSLPGLQICDTDDQIDSYFTKGFEIFQTLFIFNPDKIKYAFSSNPSLIAQTDFIFHFGDMVGNRYTQTGSYDFRNSKLAANAIKLNT